MKNYFLPSYRPKLPAGFLHKKIQANHIITHPTKPCWTMVNNLGWQIIKLLDGKKSLLDVSEIIKQRYNVAEDVLQKDIRNFMAALEKSGILQQETVISDDGGIGIKNAFLHLTDACNLACRHCYAKNMSANGKELSDVEITDFLKEFFAGGGKGFILSGGEPLMRKNLAKFFKINPKADLRFLTNATLIDEPFAAFLQQCNVAIQVSIDGSNKQVHDSIRGQGAFEAAMHGIEKLQKRGLKQKIIFCTTIMRQNFSDLHNILELAQSMGISSVRFLPLRKRGRAHRSWHEIHGGLTTKDYENFYAAILGSAQKQYPDIAISSGLSGYVLNPKSFLEDNTWCSIGKNLIIDTIGNVYPCVLLMSKKFRLGNIREHTLAELQKSGPLVRLIQDKKARKDKIAKCRQCLWKNFCQAGCLALSQERYQTLWETDEFCKFRKKLYENTVLKLAAEKVTTPYQGNDSECF